ncbi:MAG: biopolymer transporter ExbD [Myxococcales bacterium]|nr:biopolymer transporter ExbD [Myxococcales bacterium]
MKKFSGAQRARIARKARPPELTAAERSTELNIVPFLDIVVNVLMFILASISTVFIATIPVPAPSAGSSSRPAAGQERLNITVKITPQGYIIGAGGGFLMPGCTTIGQASLTVPNRGAPDQDGYTHDFAALTQCMQSLRRQFSTEIGGDHSINVSPNGEVPYGVLVHTIDAVREGRTGACRLPEDNTPANFSDPECMFPEVTLGILR